MRIFIITFFLFSCSNNFEKRCLRHASLEECACIIKTSRAFGLKNMETSTVTKRLELLLQVPELEKERDRDFLGSIILSCRIKQEKIWKK